MASTCFLDESGNTGDLAMSRDLRRFGDLRQIGPQALREELTGNDMIACRANVRLATVGMRFASSSDNDNSMAEACAPVSARP